MGTGYHGGFGNTYGNRNRPKYTIEENAKAMRKRYPLTKEGLFGVKGKNTRVIYCHDQFATAQDFYARISRGGTAFPLSNGKGIKNILYDGTIIVYRVITKTPNSPAIEIKIMTPKKIINQKIHFLKEEKQMINAKFSDQMIGTLKKLKGKQFISFFIDGDDFTDRSYCIIRIKTDAFCIDIMNEEQELPFLKSPVGNTEELSCFSCSEKNVDSPFTPYIENIGFKEIPIGEKIDKVMLITDIVSIKQENYDITLDMALIIQTNKHQYTFARQWYFDEQIFVYIDKNYDVIYPVEEVKSSWSNYGELYVDVERTIKEL